MYSWPWRRFEGMFRAHLLRRAREELRQMRDLRLAALDANMTYDSQENQDAKQQRVEGLQDAFEQAVALLYDEAPGRDAVAEAIEEDPLFGPIKRRAESLHEEINQPLVPQAGAGRKLIEAT